MLDLVWVELQGFRDGNKCGITPKPQNPKSKFNLIDCVFLKYSDDSPKDLGNLLKVRLLLIWRLATSLLKKTIPFGSVDSQDSGLERTLSLSFTLRGYNVDAKGASEPQEIDLSVD